MKSAAAESVLALIKEHEVSFVDFRFTDPRGGWHHMTLHVDAVDKDTLLQGVMFDGSSIAGWKHIDDSDMEMRPDLSTAVLDPFTSQPTLIITCDILEPLTEQSYSRDPRGVAKRAEAHLKDSGFAPELLLFGFR